MRMPYGTFVWESRAFILRITDFPVSTLACPFFRGTRDSRVQQAIDQSGGIDGQSHFGLKALFVIQLILINVANDLPCVTGKSLKVVARYDIVQSRAYRDKEIAILHCKVSALAATTPGRPIFSG